LKIGISANPLAKTQKRQEKIKHVKSRIPFAALATLREAIFLKVKTFEGRTEWQLKF
jgi:hypothetical protein